MADYHWPPTDKCNLIGRRISRLDGPWKSSGRIKYSYDVNRPNMLHGKLVFSPYAHAKVVSIDTSAAEKMPGVKAGHDATILFGAYCRLSATNRVSPSLLATRNSADFRPSRLS